MSLRACVALTLMIRSCACHSVATRRRFVALATAASPAAARAVSYQTGAQFEGGAGGLGKTKPDTGVRVAERGEGRTPSTPPGPVRARLLASDGLPVDVRYDSPWPTSAGLVSRDYGTGDGAYVLTAPARAASLEADLRRKLFAADGKYGAYGAVADVRLRSSAENGADVGAFEYTFVALSPAMREVDRRVRVRCAVVGPDAFCLVAGSTANRWRAAEASVAECLASFDARPAPDYAAETVAYRKRNGG